MFRKPELTLDELLLYSGTLELAESQAKAIEEDLPTANARSQSADVNRIASSTKPHQKFRPSKGKVTNRHPTQKRCPNVPNKYGAKSDKNCFKCAFSCPHQGQCPATGKECNSCHKIGHFSIVCRNKKPQSERVQAVTNFPAPGKTTTYYVEESDELSIHLEDYLYFIDVDIFRDHCHWGLHTSIFKADKVKCNNFKTTLFVHNVPVLFHLDTRAPLNVLNCNTYNANLVLFPYLQQILN